MPHQSLYRKYRPQTFSGVVGQEHIERTLRNAVADGSVAHAYLFTGPRGTGKTTTARILAKALDCELGPTGEPDGTCEDCIEIAEGRHPDVYEIDAASRTGVENVREEIIGRVQFAATRGRYKVYIIDEVHMLSAAAFNALLKTLEEPPPHVVFILATTHPHKVPETIQSRCQRFDFRRISVEDIAGRLSVICEGEDFDVPDAALSLIARHAAGGMRDAITTLEQLTSFTGGTVRVEDVEGLLGEVESAELFRIAGLVAQRDVAGCFRWVARFSEEGTDLAEFVRELTGHARNLYVISAVGDGEGIVDASADETRLLEMQAAEFGGPDRLARVLDLLGELAAELRWSSDPRLSLEVALTRMARPQGEMTLEALGERVESLELGVSSRGVTVVPSEIPAGRPVLATPPSAPGPMATATARVTAAGGVAGQGDMASAAESQDAAATPVEPPRGAPVVQPDDEFEPKLEPVVVDRHHAGGLDRAAVRRAWPAVMLEFRKVKPARSHLFAGAEVEVDFDGETLVVELPADQSFAMDFAEDPETREILQRAFTAVLGFAPPVRYQLGKGLRPVVGAGGPGTVAPPAPSLAAPAPSSAVEARSEPQPPAEPAFVPPSATPASVPGAAPQSELEALLTQQLGGRIVAEHPAGGEPDDVSATSDTPAHLEVAQGDFESLDDELFDPDTREDD